MPSFSDTTITIIASVAMIATFVISLLPILPGQVILWGIALVYAWATDFQHVGVTPIVIITIIALVSSLSDFWLPLLGIKTGGGTCRSIIGTIIGGILGTIFIPVPVLGTLVGSMLGAGVLEYLKRRDFQQAKGAADFAMRNFLYGFAVELIANTLILIVFFGSLIIA